MDVAVITYSDCSGHGDLNRMPAQVEVQRVTLNNKALHGASSVLWGMTLGKAARFSKRLYDARRDVHEPARLHNSFRGHFR